MNKRLFIAMLLLVAFAGSASAADCKTEDISCHLSNFGTALGNVGDAIVNAFVSFILGAVQTLLGWADNVIFTLLTTNPDLANNAVLRLAWSRVLSVSIGLFILALSWYGLRLMVVQMFSEHERMEAKENIKKALLGLFLVSISYDMYALLADLFSTVALAFKPEGTGMLAVNMAALGAVGILIGGILVPLLVSFLVILVVRIFLTALFAVLFPFALFLYFFDRTKVFGATILNMTFANFLIQPLEMVVLSTGIILQKATLTNITSSGPTNVLINAISGMAVMLIAIALPLIAYYLAFQSALSVGGGTIKVVRETTKAVAPTVSRTREEMHRRFSREKKAPAFET